MRTVTDGAPRWGLTAGLAASAVAVVLLAVRLEAAAPRVGPGVDQDLYLAPLLSTAQLASLAGGLSPALADLYWVRAVGAPPEEWNDPRGVLHIYNLLDRVTALDPRYEMPYHMGGLLLAIQGNRPDLADRILERAEGMFPADWRFPFYRGFNNLYFDVDLAVAADAMGRASRLPGSPPFLGGLARHLAQGERDPRLLIGLIERMATATDDPVLRARLLQRRARLLAALPEAAS